MNPEPGWQHRIIAGGGRSTVVLSGEIDLSGAARLQELLLAAVHAADVVAVDLAAVQFIDSSVIAALITTQHTAAAAGCRFGLVSLSPRVRRVLDITGVLDTLVADAG